MSLRSGLTPYNQSIVMLDPQSKYKSTSTMDISNNRNRNMSHGSNSLNNLSLLYNKLSRELSKIGGKLPRVNPPDINSIIDEINQSQNEDEERLYNKHLTISKADSKLINHVIDLDKVLPHYKQDFYDPTYLLFIMKFLRGIIFHDSREENNKIRVRHWVDNLKIMASGSFGLTVSANVGSIGPFLAIKTPTVALLDQRHEFLVGLSLNPLREQNLTPAFVYTYNYFKCSPAKISVEDGKSARGTPIRGWCGEGNVPYSNYVLIENIPEATTLADFIFKGKMNIPIFISTLFHILPSLHIASSHGFTHWDFHTGNCLLRRVDALSEVSYYVNNRPIYTKTFGYYPMIIDFGLSSYRVGDHYVGPNVNDRKKTSCYFQGQPFPLADVYRIIMSMYTVFVYDRLSNGRATNDDFAIVNVLEYLLEFFFNKDSRFNDGGAKLLSDLIKTKTDMISSKATNKNASSKLDSYNFYQLDNVYQPISIVTFINMVINNGVLERLLSGSNTKLSDIVSNVEGNNVLSCDIAGKCIDLFKLVKDNEKQPSDFFEVDQYGLDFTNLPKTVIRNIIKNGGDYANMLIANSLTLTQYLDTVRPITKKDVQIYSDNLVSLWHNNFEFKLLNKVVNEYKYNSKEYNDLLKVLRTNFIQPAIVNKAITVVTSALQQLYSTNSTDNLFKSELEATIALSKTM